MEFIKINREYLFSMGRNRAVKWFAVLLFEILVGGLAIVSPLFLLIFLAICASIIVFLIKPEYSLYLMILLVIPGPILSLEVGGVALRISQVFVIVVLVFWCIARFIKIQPPITGLRDTQALLFFLAWGLLSLIWSSNRTVGLEDSLKLLAAVGLILMLMAYIREVKTFRFSLVLFVFMGLIDAAVAFSYQFSGFFVQKKWVFFESLDVVYRFWVKHSATGFGGRCRGFYTAHGTAVTLSFAVTFCMMLFLVTQSRKKQLTFLGLAGILFAVMIGTLTKSIIVSVLISMIYVVLHLRPLRKRFFTAFFVIIVLSTVSFFLVRFQDFSKALYFVGENLKVDSETLNETSMGQRIALVEIGLQKLRETGGIGTGIGGFLQYTPFKYWDGSHPAILFDLGFIGMLLWIWILIGSYRLFVVAIKESDNEYYRRMLLVYLGGYINILISWFVTFSYADIYIWFYLGIGFALVNLSRTDRLERKAIMLPFPDKGESLVVI